MSRELEITAVDDATVKVKIVTDTERDLSVNHDGIDLIQKVASALRKTVHIGEKLEGDVDDAES